MEKDTSAVIQLQQEGAVMTIWLNRPESHNALNPELIYRLTAVFEDLSQRPDIRIIILSGLGRSFCAGADLSFMRSATSQSHDDNLAASLALFDLLLNIERCPKPVIGRVNGAAIGGGIGLVSCCDIVVAAERARFGFSEVRLGLIPAVISPFVLAKIGLVHGRELFLTGERFDAHHALRIGLVNHVVANEEELDATVRERLNELLLGAPGAHAAAKELLHVVSGHQKESLRKYTAQSIASLRAGEEGQEGMNAFLEKRAPEWQQLADGLSGGSIEE